MPLEEDLVEKRDFDSGDIHWGINGSSHILDTQALGSNSYMNMFGWAEGW